MFHLSHGTVLERIPNGDTVAPDFSVEKAEKAVSEAVVENLAANDRSAITRPRVVRELKSTPRPSQVIR